MEQVGRPLDLYRRPATPFVARFIGSPTMNILTARVADHADGKLSVELDGSTLSVGMPNHAPVPRGADVTIGVRAEDLIACDRSEAWFKGEISMVERLGGQTYGYLDVGNERTMTVEFPRTSEIEPGDIIAVKGDPNFLHVFDQATGARLN